MDSLHPAPRPVNPGLVCPECRGTIRAYGLGDTFECVHCERWGLTFEDLIHDDTYEPSEADRTWFAAQSQGGAPEHDLSPTERLVELSIPARRYYQDLADADLDGRGWPDA